MIDNVIMILSVLVHQKTAQAPLKDAFEDLLEKCHPLGKFENIGMLRVIDSTDALYNYVVADSPLAPYFVECLQMSDLDEVNIATIRELLYKSYLDDFYQYCKYLGGVTAEVMCSILTLEADRRTINISLFSLSSALQPVDKLKLFSNFGRLRSKQEELVKSNTSSLIRNIYKAVYCGEMGVSDSNLDDDPETEFMKCAVKMNKDSFLRPFHYGIFYSYFRLLEQEARNLQFIVECVALQMRKKIHSYIPIFD
jgi:V-type H+-transporting ATPase subunit d